jgi:type I restriction enzyme M protein
MNKQQLANKIWKSANQMRSKIEANEYKDFILGFMFYKISEALKLRKLKRFLKMEPDDPLFDNMESYNDYHDYLEIKKKNTKVAF